MIQITAITFMIIMRTLYIISYNVSIYNTGKSGGSFLQQILIGVFGSLQASTPYLGGILGLIIVAWIRAAQSLNKQFLAKNAEMEKKTWPLADFEKKEQ